MRSSPLPLVAVLVALCAGCTCGSKAKPAKPAPDYSALLKGLPRAQVSRAESVLPQTPISVVTSDAKGCWDALMASDLGKALVKGGAVDNVALSSHVEDIFSMAHDVAAASDNPLAQDMLASALVGRAAVGLLPDHGADRLLDGFVFVKEIDPSQEKVVRLAVMFASLKGAQVTDRGGQKVARIARHGSSLFLSAFQNVVIASDNEVLANQAVDLALGKPGNAAAAIPEIKEEAATLSGPQAFVRVELEPDAPASTLTGLKTVLARLELGASSVLKVRGALDADAAPAEHRAQKFVPADALLYASLGASHPEAILNRLAKAHAVDSDRVNDSFAVSPELRAAFGDEAFWALVGVDGESFEQLVGLSLKDPAKAKTLVPELLKRWGRSDLRDLSLGDATGWCVERKKLCAAVVKGFLVAATSEAQLERAVRTARGESPALSDVKGLGGAIKPGEKHFLTAFVGTPHAADGALAFFNAAGAHNNSGFDPGDVRESIEPLCQALRELPSFGGALEPKGAGAVAGELRAIQ